MKQVFIIAGPNGSGKTILAKELKKVFELEFINADEIALSLNPEHIEKVRVSAGKLFFQKIKKQIDNANSFILETTLSGGYLKKYIEKLKENGYRITLVFIFLKNTEEAVKRIYNRVKKGGHFVPEVDVKRRFYRSIKNFNSDYKNIVDHWQLYYNGTSKFIQVAFGDSDNVTIINKKLYNDLMAVCNE